MKAPARNRGFSKFLQTTRKLDFSSGEPQAAMAGGTAPVNLLAVLDTQGPSTVPALLEHTRSDFVQLAGQLKMLQDTGLVLMEGVGASQRVKLTDMGRQMLTRAVSVG